MPVAVEAQEPEPGERLYPGEQCNGASRHALEVHRAAYAKAQEEVVTKPVAIWPRCSRSDVGADVAGNNREFERG